MKKKKKKKRGEVRAFDILLLARRFCLRLVRRRDFAPAVVILLRSLPKPLPAPVRSDAMNVVDQSPSLLRSEKKDSSSRFQGRSPGRKIATDRDLYLYRNPEIMQDRHSSHVSLLRLKST